MRAGAHLDRPGEQAWANSAGPVAGNLVVERQAERRALEQGLELADAPLERQRAQVPAVELEQVERSHECMRLARE
jgi:hypothetical protein